MKNSFKIITKKLSFVLGVLVLSGFATSSMMPPSSNGFYVSGKSPAEKNSTHNYRIYDDNTDTTPTEIFLYTWTITSGTATINGTSSGWGVDTANVTLGSGTYATIRADFEDDVFNMYWNVKLVSLTAPVPSPLSDENYIYNRTARKGVDNITDFNDLENDEAIKSITYFDGLGRFKQSVGIRAGGSSQDIVTHGEYDDHGRQIKDYLPYAETTDGGSYRTDTDALDDTKAYYKSNFADDFTGILEANINPYSEKELESSPLSRVFSQAAPGEDWKLGNGKEVEFEYKTNDTDDVRLYGVSLSIASETYTPTLTGGTTYYSANELFKNITYDENNTSGTAHSVEEYKDLNGRVILKRTYGDTDITGDGDTLDTGETNAQLDTYYVYDDFGNLTYVLPPKAEPHTAKPDATELAELCYQYKYDHRNRLVEKKIPGKDWEYIVYNKLDQPVLTQDAKLKENNNDEWLFTKYDAYGRVAYTGMMSFNATTSRSSAQTTVNGTSTNYVKRIVSPTTIDGVGVYYDIATYLTSGAVVDDLHSINYYDSYINLPGTLGNTITTSYNLTSSTNTKGLPTVSKVSVLGTSQWITTVNYYDAKGRTIYIYTDNPYLETTDIVESELDFTGNPIKITTTHKKVNETDLVTVDLFDYDHMGRIKEHKQTINGGSEEVIVQNIFDELGQLESKKVGNTVSNPLQTIEYGYNVRGWLKEINNTASLGTDLFAFKINYNSVGHNGTPLFNGNIAETEWKTANTDTSLKWYAYEYDAVNRITGATSDTSGRYSLSDINYDKNGNITNLTRAGHKVTNPVSTNSLHFTPNMDKLFYSYGTSAGNQLYKVRDDGEDNYGFKDSSVDNQDYWYDLNGNMTKDDNKGITLITYNHLNLPTEVQFGATDKIQYIYDAVGSKLQKTIIESGNTTDYTKYAGNYVYKKSGMADALEFFNHPEGYVDASGSNFEYVYQYKDHLGNIRLSYKNTGSTSTPVLQIQEENNYYPFGLKHKGYNNVINGTDHPYGYNGKEENDEMGLAWLDYGKRNYDASIGRWMNHDPLAEAMEAYSPYTFAFNNPMLFVDPDGALPWPIHLRSFISSSTTGGGRFRGDGRGASTEPSPEATSRVRSTVTVDPQGGPDGYTTSNLKVDSDPTVFYGIGRPGSPGYIPPAVGTSDSKMNLNSGNSTQTSSTKGEANVNWSHSGKDPLTPEGVTPALDAHIDLNLAEDLDAGTLTITGEVTGDSFPSTEAFITDQSGNTNLLLGASMEDGGLLDLFGDNKKSLFKINMTVNIDKNGNFTGVTQGDKTYSVKEWNSMVQEQFNNNQN